MHGGRWTDWLCRRRARVALPVAFALLSTGCIQGPNYTRPAVSVPPTYRSSSLANVLPSASDTRSWWHDLGDEHLDSLVHEALDNNGDLKVATARVSEFAAILAGTRAQAFPQI